MQDITTCSRSPYSTLLSKPEHVTIGEEAVKRYEENEGPGTFSAALLRCFLFGIVVKRPDFILLAEPVQTDGKQIIAIGPGCRVRNCWWVWYAASNQGKTSPIIFMDEAPFALPYIGFKRRGKLKIYSWNHIRKDIRKDMDVYGRRTASFSSTNT